MYYMYNVFSYRTRDHAITTFSEDNYAYSCRILNVKYSQTCRETRIPHRVFSQAKWQSIINK